MKILTILFLLLFSTQAFAADFEFLPADPKLSFSFEGKTQAGIEKHRFELRQLSHVSDTGIRTPTYGYYIIYYAGNEYGPEVLGKIDGHAPILKKINNDIEIYFIAGAHTHIKQIWHLQGATASKKSEKTISWKERPKA